MKKFVDKGEYFALSIYKILQNPLVIETTEMRNPAQVICEDAFYLSPTGNGETSIEILRIAGDFKGSEILHFIVFRTHSSVESECVLRQEALLQGALACLHHAGYVVEEVAYEQYHACQKHVDDKAFWFMTKQESKEAGLHGSYKSSPILTDVDWKSIYSSLDGSGCVFAIQVIPRRLTDVESEMVLNNHIACTHAVKGMVANVRDPLAEKAMDRWNYYANRVNGLFADVNIVVGGPPVNVALMVARIRQSMNALSFDSIQAAGIGRYTLYNQPWLIANHIKQNTTTAFPKYSIEEAGLLAQLPVQGCFYTGVEENPFSLTPETTLISSELTKCVKDTVRLGKSVFSNQIIALPHKQLLLHTAVLGKSGVGKTTLLKQMIRQLDDAGIPVLIFEPVKREYRDMISGLNNSRVFTVERPGVPLLLNPFSVPDGVPLCEYRSSLLSAFKAAFSMPDPLPALFEKAISEVYTLHGWTDMNLCTDASVTTFDMHDFIHVFKRIILHSTYSNEVKGNMMSGGAFRLQSLIERCPRTFDSIHATAVDDYLLGCSVLEMGTLEPEQKNLVTALILIRILVVLKASRNSDSRLRNVILIDEVHALLDHGEGATQEEKALNNTMSQLLINIITELRAYGVGVVFSDQSPSRIGGCMLDNVDNLISFRLSGEEADLLRAHMGAKENLTACLPLARTGEFFLKNQYIREPLGIRMSKAKISISPHNYSDRQIASMQKEYLQSRAAIYCPYKSCKATGCNCCSIAIREEAHKYATQIYNERQDKLGTVEAIASHILKIPTVIGTKSRNLPDSGTPKLFHCIAIHLLRVCALEKGISISNEAVIKLLMDMDRTAKEGIKNE